MSNALLRSVLGLAASAALAGPALAADIFSANATVQDFDSGCTNLGTGGGGSGPSPTQAGFACPSGEAAAFSRQGHVGASLHVSGNSIVSAIADYTTEVRFLPTGGQDADVIPVALNLQFGGLMGVGGSADTGYNIVADIAHVDFLRSTSIDTGALPSHGVMTLGFSSGGEIDNQLSAFMGGVLTTGQVMVPVGQLVGITIHLGLGGFGNPGSLNDLFESSLDFVTGRDLFTLPDGFTAEDPDAFIVDNRFTPPAGGVPEPASWALMIAGFGLAGAALRRRRAAAELLRGRSAVPRAGS